SGAHGAHQAVELAALGPTINQPHHTSNQPLCAHTHGVGANPTCEPVRYRRYRRSQASDFRLMKWPMRLDREQTRRLMSAAGLRAGKPVSTAITGPDADRPGFMRLRWCRPSKRCEK